MIHTRNLNIILQDCMQYHLLNTFCINIKSINVYTSNVICARPIFTTHTHFTLCYKITHMTFIDQTIIFHILYERFYKCSLISPHCKILFLNLILNWKKFKLATKLNIFELSIFLFILSSVSSRSGVFFSYFTQRF